MRKIVFAVLLFTAVAAKGQCTVTPSGNTVSIYLGGTSLVQGSLVTNSDGSGIGGSIEDVGLADYTTFASGYNGNSNQLQTRLTEFDETSRNYGGLMAQTAYKPPLKSLTHTDFFVGLTTDTGSGLKLVVRAWSGNPWALSADYEYTAPTLPYWVKVTYVKVGTYWGITGFGSSDGVSWTNLGGVIQRYATGDATLGAVSWGMGENDGYSLYADNVTFNGSNPTTNFLETGTGYGVAVNNIQAGVLGVAVAQTSGTASISGNCGSGFPATATFENSVVLEGSLGSSVAQWNTALCVNHTTCQYSFPNPLNFPHQTAFSENVFQGTVYKLTSISSLLGANPPGYNTTALQSIQVIFRP